MAPAADRSSGARARALAAAAAAALTGCWAHVSDVDIVADAAVEQPVLASGVYCPVQIWNEVTEIDYSDCDRIGWDAGEGRHYYADARVRWDDLERRPVAPASLDGFGATSVWLDAADLGQGLALLQREAADGAGFGEDIAVPARYVASVVFAGEGGFAVLPMTNSIELLSLAESRGVTLEPYDVNQVRGMRIVSGESAAARAVVADSARAWLAARREGSGDFRQLPANRSEIGPLYYVRLDAMDPTLPSGVAIESAMFEIEQRLRAIAAAPDPVPDAEPRP